jgi:hypothetical protein
MYDEPTIAALESGNLVLRDLLWVAGQTLAGAAATFGLWTGESNVTVNVVNLAGSTVSRSYVGGTLVEVPAIVDTIGLGARSVEFGLNHLHATVANMVRGNNIRLARVEMHRAIFSPLTGELVSTPFLRFAGRVDGAPIETPAVGGEGRVTLRAVAHTIDLTRTNTALKSDEQQRRRSGDRFRRYSDTAGEYQVFWGQARG